jgi:hypothetical protein
MHEHGPNCLEGPIRGSNVWWRGLAAPKDSAETKANQITKKSAKMEDSGIRKELVERVRREIEAGTYDTPEKWDAALEALLERMHGD